MKKFSKYVITYLVMIILLFGLLLITSLIPRESIKSNIEKSADILINEGERFSIPSFGKENFNDNSTDAIMLNIIYSIDNKNIIESSLKARRNYIPGKTQNVVPDMIGDLPHEGEIYLMTKELQDTANDVELNSYEYARYWHGYMSVLRPLLVFFDITEIRIIIQIALITSLLIMLYYVYKNVNFKIAILILLCFISMDMLTWITTIQGNFVMLIAIIISIFVANKKITSQKFNMILFVVGGITVYLDFLTTPFVTFLLPVIIFNLVNNENKNCKKVLCEYIKRMLAWGLGYALVWIAKWVLIDLLYGTRIIENSIIQISYRTGIASKPYIPVNMPIIALKNNYLAAAMNLFNITLLLLMYPIFFAKLAEKGKSYFFSANKLVYYISAVMPVIWFLILAEHSAQHYFFTYKNALMTLISIVLIICDNKKYLNESK